MKVTLLRPLISKKYGYSTLLIVIACGVMVRLGFWQLDRLAQRQALNTEIRQKLDAPPLFLSGDTLINEPETLKFRAATVRGVFDHSQEVALQGQHWQEQPGVHLITPLVIEGSSQAVLVDRGWIPAEVAEPGQWPQFATTGGVAVSGIIQPSQPRPDAPPLTEPELSIFRVDIDRLQEQISHPLLPVFIVQLPRPGQSRLPYRSAPEIRLNNGPHLGYAIQWFAFSLILAAGYTRFIYRHSQPVAATETIPLSTLVEA